MNLFIDDIRDLDWKEVLASGIDPTKPWVIARNSAEAKAFVLAHGMPTALALDHDLGELEDGTIDTVPDFLKWLAYDYWTNEPVPEYTIHSSNPAGCWNMKAFMESWKKSALAT